MWHTDPLCKASLAHLAGSRKLLYSLFFLQAMPAQNRYGQEMVWATDEEEGTTDEEYKTNEPNEADGLDNKMARVSEEADANMDVDITGITNITYSEADSMFVTDEPLYGPEGLLRASKIQAVARHALSVAALSALSCGNTDAVLSWLSSEASAWDESIDSIFLKMKLRLTEKIFHLEVAECETLFQQVLSEEASKRQDEGQKESVKNDKKKRSVSKSNFWPRKHRPRRDSHDGVRPSEG